MMLNEATRRQILLQRQRYPQAKSAVLPALWAVQHQIGYLPAEAFVEVAELLGLTPGEVQAVSTFYSMYFQRPEGRHHVLVCVNVACALRGAEELCDALEEHLDCLSGDTTEDGAITWEKTIECLGGCGGAPMMQVDHHFHENLTAASAAEILERYRSRPALHGGNGPGTSGAGDRATAATAAGRSPLADERSTAEQDG